MMRDTALDESIRLTWRSWRDADRAVRRRPGSERHVHDFRVATRRLLAVEALAAPSRSGADRPLAAEVAQAFKAAGRLRDLQLCVDRLDRLRVRHPVAASVVTQARRRIPRRERRFEKSLAALDRDACRHAVRALRAAADGERAARRLQSQRDGLLGTLDKLPADPSVAALHRLRVQLKRVRYGEEWMATAHPGVAVDARQRRALARLQDRLGRIADARVLERAILRWPPHDLPDARATDRLLHDVQRPCAAEWADAEDVAKAVRRPRRAARRGGSATTPAARRRRSGPRP